MWPRRRPKQNSLIEIELIAVSEHVNFLLPRSTCSIGSLLHRSPHLAVRQDPSSAMPVPKSHHRLTCRVVDHTPANVSRHEAQEKFDGANSMSENVQHPERFGDEIQWDAGELEKLDTMKK